jgi:hypothetical protein
LLRKRRISELWNLFVGGHFQKGIKVVSNIIKEELSLPPTKPKLNISASRPNILPSINKKAAVVGNSPLIQNNTLTLPPKIFSLSPPKSSKSNQNSIQTHRKQEIRKPKEIIRKGEITQKTLKAYIPEFHKKQKAKFISPSQREVRKSNLHLQKEYYGRLIFTFRKFR